MVMLWGWERLGFGLAMQPTYRAQCQQDDARKPPRPAWYIKYGCDENEITPINLRDDTVFGQPCIQFSPRASTRSLGDVDSATYAMERQQHRLRKFQH
jgi:hypothetical protein